MIKIISLSILLLITILYNGIIFIKHKKIPESLSETAYIMGGTKRYFFTLYTICIVGFLIPFLFTYTNDNWMFLPFLFCGGILFAGFSPLFKEGIEKDVHYTSAILSFLIFLLYMIFYMGWQWMIGYIIMFILSFLWKKEKIVYLAEMIALIELIIWLYIQ
jgi:hypothetical protein